MHEIAERFAKISCGGKSYFFLLSCYKKKVATPSQKYDAFNRKMHWVFFQLSLKLLFFFSFLMPHTYFSKIYAIHQIFLKKNIWYNSYTLAWFVYLLERHHIQNYVKSLMMLCNKIGFRHNFKILLMSLRQVEKSTHFRKIYEAMYFISCEKSYA